MADLVAALKALLSDPVLFARLASGLTLRRYQEAVARAVVESVVSGAGRSFVVMFPRQSGKNELQAQIEVYLLTLFSQCEAEIVKVSPTWKPQSLNAMRRLERVLAGNVITRPLWRKESGYIYRVGRARIFFLSGGPETNIVGATASTLLEVDEAQDVSIAKFDKDIAPMAASTNATRVFWGTAWTSQTLLARELRAAREAEQVDGVRRVFALTADEVAAEVPAYGQFVAGQVARLGRTHPLVKTQFYSEEVDGEGGMFPASRLAVLQPSGEVRRPGGIIALLLDVAGEDEGGAGGGLSNPGRDATALTVVQVDLSTVNDPLLQAPTYHCISRRSWVGVKHTALYGQIRALAETLGARRLVVDATGVGAGLASFLGRALPGKVTPFVFSAASKSKLGWDFLALVDAGRWRESAAPDEESRRGQAAFLRQLSFCQYEILPGPGQMMRWGVPDGTRDPLDGEPVHDDWVLSAALAAALDGLDWSGGGPALVVPGVDPLRELDRGY